MKNSFLILLLALSIGIGCGPLPSERPDPASRTRTSPEPSGKKALTNKEIISWLDDIITGFASSSEQENVRRIKDLNDHLAASFPLTLTHLFSLHGLHDQFMKITGLVKDKNSSDINSAWKSILNTLDNKTLKRGSLSYVFDAKLLKDVLDGRKPNLVTTLRENFTGFTNQELAMRDKVSFESFGSSAYPDFRVDAGKNTTGAVVVTHDANIIALLEFKNILSKNRVFDPTNPQDLRITVSKLPGYVSMVGRLAAYSRFAIGEKMFEKFFEYAEQEKLPSSYLHVREDNQAAIALYTKLGYVKIGVVPNYYQENPKVDGHVMKKTFP